MVLFIMLYNVVLTIKSVDETPVCGYSNESSPFMRYLIGGSRLLFLSFQIAAVANSTEYRLGLNKNAHMQG